MNYGEIGVFKKETIFQILSIAYSGNADSNLISQCPRADRDISSSNSSRTFNGGRGALIGHFNIADFFKGQSE